MPDESGKQQGIGYGRPPVHTRFKPGQSGNPKGRPRGIPDLAAAINRKLDAEDDDGRPQIERVAEKLLELFHDGHPVAVREVLRRLWPEKAAELAIRVTPPVEWWTPDPKLVEDAAEVMKEILGHKDDGPECES